MPPLPLTHDSHRRLKWAGAAYLVIILAGVSSEMGFRAVALTTPNTAAQAFALKVSLVLDALMLTADVIVAVLLFAVFRAVNEVQALSAMIFRLMQAAIIGASLMLQLVALQMPEHIAPLLAAQSMGYDLGLIFFAVNTGLMATLLCHSGLAPKGLPPALMLSALVYVAGSLSALLAPDLSPLFEPAYVLPLIAETWFCVWLLFGRRKTAKATTV